jgi:cardiolipin synthase
VTNWDIDGASVYVPRWTMNDATLHVDGDEIFAAMEAMLRRAKHLIQIDYYVFSGKEAGRLAEILKQQLKAGVTVEMMVDPHLGIIQELKNGSTPVLQDLVTNGVQVRVYPLDKLQAQVAQQNIVDHDKVVVIDGQEAMVGGMNIADLFMKNHDYMVELAGPAAADLARNLRHDYKLAAPFTGKASVSTAQVQAQPAVYTAKAVGEGAQVRVCTTGLNRTFNLDYVLDAINHAQQTVIDALLEAQKRGVDVRVILDPGNHDDLIPLIKKAPKGFPNLPAALTLKRANIPVKWYHLAPGQDEMHAKMAVMDNSTCFIGSTNWTYNGFAHNNETSLQIVGGSAPVRLQQTFLQDWETTVDEISDAEWVANDIKAWVIRHTYFP